MRHVTVSLFGGFLLLAIVASASHYSPIPPIQHATANPDDFACPYATTLYTGAADSPASTFLAEVWLRFKLDKLGKPTAPEVLWCSAADSSYETAALEAMVSKIFDREKKVWGKTGKWLRHTVYFRTQPSSTTNFDNPSSADSLVVPEMLDPRQPVYPLSAKKANKQGSITVHALVDGSGTVIEAYCDTTCKINSLNNAALMAAFQNKFKPGSIDGKITAGWVEFRVDFKLSNG